MEVEETSTQSKFLRWPACRLQLLAFLFTVKFGILLFFIVEIHEILCKCFWFKHPVLACYLTLINPSDPPAEEQPSEVKSNEETTPEQQKKEESTSEEQSNEETQPNKKLKES